MKKRMTNKETLQKKQKEIKRIRAEIFEELGQSRVMTDIVYTDLLSNDLLTIARSRHMIQIVDDGMF